MDGALIASNLVLWVVVIALGVTVLALARQVGVLHERIAPAGALMIGRGPQVGDAAPIMEFDALDGTHVRVGGDSPNGRNTLLFFLSPTCPVCDTLLPVLRSLGKDEAGWLDIVLASDGEPELHRAFYEAKDLRAFPYIVSAQLGLAYQVGKLPFAILIDEAGTVRGRGLTNNREHLESLFEAKERGVSSIQEYVAQRSSGGTRDVA